MKNVTNILYLSEIVNNYDIFILDQWGVMHDGCLGYPKAITCVEKLIKAKKKLIIISNSSKRKISTLIKLPKLGFKKDDFIEVMTSGEVIWKSLFLKSSKSISDIGKNCFHLFDKKNKEGKHFPDGLDFNLVQSVKEADFILACTTSQEMTTINYVPLLEEALKKKIPFVCANPDFETINPSSNELLICMGTIAKLYEDMGGKVISFGKPNIKIYKEAFKKIEKIEKKRILAIGDSIHHDIKGAKSFGVDSMLISSGIHKSLFNKKPEWYSKKNTLQKFNIEPTYLSPRLQF